MHKPVFLIGWLCKSHLLTADEFERLKTGAEVLEQDAHGLKVLRLQNGDILKFFRVKHLISSARLFSHARSFCRNAKRLEALGIPTITIKQLYALPDTINTAVLYRPLNGSILRDIARSEGLNAALLKQLGIFVADLHRRGVFFRSLHLGNVVRTDTEALGLIDIADLSVRPWSLFCTERIRNFRHLCRLEEDRALIGHDSWQIFSSAYGEAARLHGRCRPKMEQVTKRWFSLTGIVKKRAFK